MLVVGLDAVPRGITGVMPAVLAHFGIESSASSRRSVHAA
jgi:hypothetical protein